MMCGCGDKRSGLGFWVVVLIVLFMVGCSGAPVKEQIREKICPKVICEKCPDIFVDAESCERRLRYAQASEAAADRLEDALSEAEADYEACEANWQRYQRKSR